MAPPTTVTSISQNEGQPPLASTMAGIVVTKSRTMMRGLGGLKYAHAASRSPPRQAAAPPRPRHPQPPRPAAHTPPPRDRREAPPPPPHRGGPPLSPPDA